ncbi:MAG: NAD(P)-dependent oxidoreductase [Rhodocyclaceae bacterium]|nr:NAD(P)-dependent oxidoreductase [Rhodocyclaceae bacterium]
MTGASGFVGVHLLEALVACGIETTALHFSSKPHDSSDRNELITWVRADLTSEDIDHYLPEIEVIFHLAGYSGLGADRDTVKRLNDINVLATERVATAALKADCRLVYVSSVSAGDAADEQTVVDETNGLPLTEYGRSKRRAEKILESLGCQGLDFTILRPTQLFGEYHRGSVYELVRAIQRRHFFLIGDGKNATNFYYIKDFVQVLLSVAENVAAHNNIYICADIPVPLGTLVEEISAHLNTSLRDMKISREFGMLLGGFCDVVEEHLRINLPLTRQRVRAMTRDVRYSNQKFAKDIGKVASHGTLAGLARTIEWYRSSGLLK